MLSLAGNVLFDCISPQTRDWLARIGERRTYADGELIHSRGDHAPTMGIVIAGAVRLTRLQTDGSSTFVSMVKEGQHFGDVLLIGDRPRTHHATAVGQVEIDHYDQAAFARILEKHEVLLAFYRISALRLTASIAMSDDLRALPREMHLAKLLQYLSRQNGGQSAISCTQEDLAGLIGTSVVSLARYLGILKKAGLIETGYREVRIVDPRRLQSWIRTYHEV